MTELNVILDNSLKQIKVNQKADKPDKADKAVHRLNNQLHWDRQNPLNYYSQFEHTEDLISDFESDDKKIYQAKQTDHRFRNEEGM